MLYIDTKAIAEHKGIMEGQVLKLTLAECIDIEEKIKAATIEARRADTVALERYKKYFRAYPIFVKLFGVALTDKYLVTVPFNEIVTTEWHRAPLASYYDQYEVVSKGVHTFKEFKGHWEREVRDNGYELRVPSQYQGLRHASIITGIITERYPWLLENFKCQYYELNDATNACNEFYLATSSTGEDDSRWAKCKFHLYVPWDAFVARDVAAIRKRNEEYIRWYYRDEKIVQSVLNAPETIKFFEFLTTEA